MLELKLVEAEYIELCDLLKAMDLCDSGGAAKHIIASGAVKVNGLVETRKRCKIRRDQVVEYNGSLIKVV